MNDELQNFHCKYCFPTRTNATERIMNQHTESHHRYLLFSGSSWFSCDFGLALTRDKIPLRFIISILLGIVKFMSTGEMVRTGSQVPFSSSIEGQWGHWGHSHWTQQVSSCLAS
uniref:Uncharacterized protein n=1 Tax=Arundo donax TaxID=35708 RepID=A0A0A9EK63_ARUDO